MERIRNVVHNTKSYILVGLVALALGIVGTGIYSYYFVAPVASRVTDIFVDINGDGLEDYIFEATVLINTGDKPFLDQ